VPIVCPIDGMQEVPPNGSSGAGVGLFAYDAGPDDLSYDIRFAGLGSNETAAHIHGFAPPGGNAGVLQALPLGNRKLGVWNFGAANQDEVFAGLTYVNIHSVNLPGGEIRGQITGFLPPPAADVSDPGAVLSMKLAPNFPNPFQSATTIEFGLERATSARIAIYDPQGRLIRNVADGDYAPGIHVVQWDGIDESGQRVASGVYRYVLHTSEGDVSGRLTLMR